MLLRRFVTGVTTVLKGWLPILFGTLIVAALCVFGDPVYLVNDDPFLAMVGGGFGVAVRPEAHLVWSHVGYGLILNSLSRIVGANAHGWLTIASVWLSLVLMIGAALKAGSVAVRAAVLLVCFGCVYFAAILSAQFTITAAILFGAGIAVCFVWVEDNPLRSWVWIVAAVTALILSYLIRPNSYLMGLVIVSPALLLLCLRRSRFALPARVLALVLVTIAVVGYATDKLSYETSADWRPIPHYFDLAANFTDFNRVPWIPQAPEYKKVGWSNEDFILFSHWYTRHPIFSTENIALLVNKLGPTTNLAAAGQVLSWFGFAATSWFLIPTLCCQIAICLLLEKNRKLIGLLLMLGQFAAISAAGVTGRVPLDYVWDAAADATLLMLCALLVSAPSATSNPLKKQLGLALTGLVGLGAAIYFCLDHIQVSRDAKAYREWAVQNQALFNGKVAVWDVGIMWEWLITPTKIYFPFPQLKVASIDDVNSMPVETEMLETLGIDDLAKELCTNGEMRLFCPRVLVEHLARFCDEHYGIKPVFREAAAWRFQGVYVLENPELPKEAAK
jgi:hypothetical protein